MYRRNRTCPVPGIDINAEEKVEKGLEVIIKRPI